MGTVSFGSQTYFFIKNCNERNLIEKNLIEIKPIHADKICLTASANASRPSAVKPELLIRRPRVQDAFPDTFPENVNKSARPILEDCHFASRR